MLSVYYQFTVSILSVYVACHLNTLSTAVSSAFFVLFVFQSVQCVLTGVDRMLVCCGVVWEQCSVDLRQLQFAV